MVELVSRHTVTRRSLRRGRLGADSRDRHRRSQRHRRSRQPTVSGKYKYKHNAWSAMLFPRVLLCAEQGVSAAAWPCRLQALPRRRTPSGGGTADGSPNCCAPGLGAQRGGEGGAWRGDVGERARTRPAGTPGPARTARTAPAAPPPWHAAAGRPYPHRSAAAAAEEEEDPAALAHGDPEPAEALCGFSESRLAGPSPFRP